MANFEPLIGNVSDNDGIIRIGKRKKMCVCNADGLYVIGPSSFSKINKNQGTNVVTVNEELESTTETILDIVDSDGKNKKRKNGKKDKKRKAKKASFENLEICEEAKITSGNKLAMLFLLKKHVFCLDGQVYVYDKKSGYFKSGEKNTINAEIRSIIPEEQVMTVSTGVTEEAHKLLLMNKEIVITKDKTIHEDLINCKNGVVDIMSTKFVDHSHKYKFTSVMNASYKENSVGANFDRFLDDATLGDRSLKRLLAEVMGYCISNYTKAKKAFIIYGPGDSGKSIFLQFLTELVGSCNVSNITLQALSDERYLCNLKGKHLNIVNELPSSPTKDLGIFKTLTSGNDMISFRKMRENPTSEMPRLKLLFGSNHFPVLALNEDEDQEPFFNRILILPFLNKIADENKDLALLDKLIAERDYIFIWALKGLKRYIANGYRFSKCKVSEEHLREYIAKYNPVKGFVEKCIVFDIEARCSSTSVNDSYCKYCIERSIEYKPADITKLTEHLTNNPHVIKKRIRIDGDSLQGYSGLRLKG